MSNSGAPRPCGRVYPDKGPSVVCELVDGHEGPHRAPAAKQSPDGELYFVWTDYRDPEEPDSR